MKFQSYLIGMLIISAIAFGLDNFMTDLGDPLTPDDKTDAAFYGVDDVRDGYDYKIFQKVDQINEDWNYTLTKINQMTGSDQDTEYEDYRVGLWQRTKDFVLGAGGATLGGAKAVTGTLSLGTTMLAGATSKITHLPQEIVSVLYGILVILLGLQVWKFITGREM